MSLLYIYQIRVLKISLLPAMVWAQKVGPQEHSPTLVDLRIAYFPNSRDNTEDKLAYHCWICELQYIAWRPNIHTPFHEMYIYDNALMYPTTF